MKTPNLFEMKNNKAIEFEKIQDALTLKHVNTNPNIH